MKFLTSGSDGVRTLTLDTLSAAFAGQNRLYIKKKLIDPVPHQYQYQYIITPYQKATKLNSEQSQEAIRRHRAGESLRELASHFGVSHETIRRCLLKEKEEKNGT